jgi:hypothetical protein
MVFPMSSPAIMRIVFAGVFFTASAGFSSPEAPNSPTPKPSLGAASPTPKPTPKPTPDEEEEEIRRNHRFLGDPVRPPVTRMFVGHEISVPTQYNPPRITPQATGGANIQPATPSAFETRRTGVSIDPSGFEETELEGFIDYGSPIRTVLPVYNEKGELVGTPVQEHPNPILQPVFRTIRRE